MILGLKAFQTFPRSRVGVRGEERERERERTGVWTMEDHPVDADDDSGFTVDEMREMRKAAGIDVLQKRLKNVEKRLKIATSREISSMKLRAFHEKASMRETADALVRARARASVRKRQSQVQKKVQLDRGAKNNAEIETMQSFPEKVGSKKAVSFLLQMRNDVYLRRRKFEMEKADTNQGSLSHQISIEQRRMAKKLHQMRLDLDENDVEDIWEACDDVAEEFEDELVSYAILCSTRILSTAIISDDMHT